MDILANAYGGITGIKAPSGLEMMEKINEIIDYLNEQEKINSYRVNWTHQDSITGKNIV